MEYDSRQRLLRMTNPKGEVTRREYNLRGDLLLHHRCGESRTQMFWDGNGRLIREERRVQPAVVLPSLKSRVTSTTAQTGW